MFETIVVLTCVLQRTVHWKNVHALFYHILQRYQFENFTQLYVRFVTFVALVQNKVFSILITKKIKAIFSARTDQIVRDFCTAVAKFARV
jgi:hypothetical protein